MQPPDDAALREAVRIWISPPNRESVSGIARYTGITAQTSHTWRRQWQKQGQLLSASPEPPEQWTAADKLAAVIQAAGLSGTELGTFCPERGLYPRQVEVLPEHHFNQDQAGLRRACSTPPVPACRPASGRGESRSALARQRSFWLVADGSFRVQVPCLDGEPLYPIHAPAAAGEQQRSIRMEFRRQTPVARVNSREEAQLALF